MKLRLGFVSNSSSTSYVIALSRDIEVTPEKLANFLEECNQYLDEDEKRMTSEEGKKAISKAIKDLCSQGEFSWYDGDIEIEHFHQFMQTFEDEIEICATDGGHGCDSLCNILADDMINKTVKFAGSIISKLKEGKK